MPFPSPQGSQVYLRGLSRALARRGHAVTVACYAHGLGEPDPEYRVVRTPPVPGYASLRAGPDLIKPWLDLALAVRLSGLRADVVHAHNYEAPLAAAVAGLWTGAPMVYTAHNTMAEELPAYFSGRLARRVARRGGQLLDRSVPRMAAHAVAIRPSTVGFLRAAGCRRVSHVAPGVDPADLTPISPAPLSPGPWVIYAGNPDRYQELEVLVAAMRRVPEAGLLLVSASPLGALARCGLPRLRCVVTTDFAEVRALMAAAQVAALPRSVCSGYPIKLLNYLGCGLPTVAAAGAAPTMPGMAVVPARDPEAMAAVIRALLGDPARRRAMGAAGRAHVLGQCTWAARAVELEAIYESVLRDQQRRGIVRTSVAAGQESAVS